MAGDAYRLELFQLTYSENGVTISKNSISLYMCMCLLTLMFTRVHWLDYHDHRCRWLYESMVPVHTWIFVSHWWFEISYGWELKLGVGSMSISKCLFWFGAHMQASLLNTRTHPFQEFQTREQRENLLQIHQELHVPRRVISYDQ